MIDLNNNSELEKAHQYCTNNKEQLIESNICGCFYCCKIYSPKEIKEYLNSELGARYGIAVTEASIIDVHPDEQLQKTINERVTAMQKKQQAEAEQETIKVQNETKILEAKAKAEAKIIAAQAEAEANKIIANSITKELLKMEEMEARQEHGWVTVQGASTVVANTAE